MTLTSASASAQPGRARISPATKAAVAADRALTMRAPALTPAPTRPRKQPAAPSRDPAPAPKKPGEILPGTPSQRVFGASAVRLGCNPYVDLPCDGLAPYRMGQTAGHAALVGPRGMGPSVSFQGATRPDEINLTSQVIATVGLKKKFGRGWVHGGVGIADERSTPNPKPLTISETAHGVPVLAMATGVGIDFGTETEPLSFAIDAGSSIEESGAGRIYQWSASVVHKF